MKSMTRILSLALAVILALSLCAVGAFADDAPPSAEPEGETTTEATPAPEVGTPTPAETTAPTATPTPAPTAEPTAAPTEAPQDSPGTRPGLPRKSIPPVKTSRILRNLGARAFLKDPTIPRRAAPY